MKEDMSNAQFNAYLETLAKLVESKAKTVEEAAEIIRQAKTQQKKGSDRRQANRYPHPSRASRESLTPAVLQFITVRLKCQYLGGQQNGKFKN
jgi:hypothetical protein